MTTGAKAALQDLLTAIVRTLVDRPDNVAIELVEGEGSTSLQIRCDPADVGKLVGHHGRTVHAIRVVVNAAAAKRGCGRFVIEVVEPGTSTPAACEGPRDSHRPA